MSKRLTALLKFGFFICVLPASALAENMILKFEDLPKLIESRNENLKAAQSLESAAEKGTGYLTRSFLPTLKLDAGTERFRTAPDYSATEPYGGIEARINLFRGGRDNLENDLRQNRLQVSRLNEVKTSSDILRTAQDFYWTLVYQRELSLIVKEALKENEGNLKSAERRLGRGLTGKADLIDFKMNDSLLREDLESLEHENIIIEMKLAALLGFDETMRFQTPEQVPHQHDDNLVTSKFSAEHTVSNQLLSADLESMTIQNKQASRWWLPQVDLYAGYYLFTFRDRTFTSQSDRVDNVVGVRLTMDLFDGLQSTNRSSVLSEQNQALELNLRQEKRESNADILSVQEELKHLHELIHNADGRVEQGKTYLSVSLDEYRRGIKNSPDVLGASQKYSNFKRRSAEIRRDYQFSKAKLARLLAKQP